MLNIDLHCHSNVSDGVLPPAEVVARAAANGVHVLALTDHDDVAGLAAAQAATEGTELALIPGVEISVTWNGQTVHIVGLRIDPAHPELAAGLHNIRMGRIERAQRMGAALARSASGGTAVIAHPGRDAFNARELHLLLDAFRALGGEGIEVITGSHHPSEYGKFADLARAFGLKASRGADFHAPGEGIDIGRLPALPHYCQPVWQGWPELDAHFSLSPT